MTNPPTGQDHTGQEDVGALLDIHLNEVYVKAGHREKLEAALLKWREAEASRRSEFWRKRAAKWKRIAESEQREARIDELEPFAEGKLKPVTMYAYAKERYAELKSQGEQNQ